MKNVLICSLMLAAFLSHADESTLPTFYKCGSYDKDYFMEIHVVDSVLNQYEVTILDREGEVLLNGPGKIQGEYRRHRKNRLASGSNMFSFKDINYGYGGSVVIRVASNKNDISFADLNADIQDQEGNLVDVSMNNKRFVCQNLLKFKKSEMYKYEAPKKQKLPEGARRCFFGLGGPNCY